MLAASSDGRRFVYNTSEGLYLRSLDAQHLLMIPFEGSEVEPEIWLGRTFADDSAVFSPDGRYVAYVSNEMGQREVYVRPFAGQGGQEPVSVEGGEEPTWAPNGELFTAERLRDDGGRRVDRSDATGRPPARALHGRQSCWWGRNAG